jgi:hypothetical protein
MWYRVALLLLFTATVARGQTPEISQLINQSWFHQAPLLPPPSGEVIKVSAVDELFRAVDAAKPGATILLADGRYMMPRYLEIKTDNVTLRSASGQRDRVILDGAESRHGELVGITRCSGVTIADLTIQNIKWNGFKINSNTNVQNATIYNCVIHNSWQRGVKGVSTHGSPSDIRPRNCRIQYCLFYLDRPKGFSDDPRDTPKDFNGNYVGGIDVMGAKNWTISDNVFVGIHGRTALARGAIFLWQNSEGCLIERNVITDCDVGIALGNSHKPPYIATHCIGFVVRNNFVTRAPESGILADYTKDCRIVHNTIHDPQSRPRRLIRLVHDNDGLLVANNLLSGPEMRIETTSTMSIRDNVTKVLTDRFVNARDGDLHLAGDGDGVVNASPRLADVSQDIDGQPRADRPDIGADEFLPTAKTP